MMLQQINGQIVLTELKSAASRRTLVLPESLVVSLREHRKHQLEERLLAGAEWEDQDLVFTTNLGRPLGGRNVLRDFQAALRRAKVRKVTFHSLRHAAASLLLSQGLDMKVVQDVLGHSDIRLTANTYAHLLPQLRQAAADAMDNALGVWM